MNVIAMGVSAEAIVSVPAKVADTKVVVIVQSPPALNVMNVSSFHRQITCGKM
jgi:hypothetical protein